MRVVYQCRAFTATILYTTKVLGPIGISSSGISENGYFWFQNNEMMMIS